jgi:hypothetical protein
MEARGVQDAGMMGSVFGWSLAVGVGLFIAMLLGVEGGRQLAVRRAARGDMASKFGAVDGAMFGLLGLLVAFTFSGAADRFHQRRALIVDEANAVGTAWLRLDLLPADAQPALRDLFRQYVDVRLETHRLAGSLDASRERAGAAARLQSEIWAKANAAYPRAQSPQVMPVVASALNEMFDLGATRVFAMLNHPPRAIYGMLCVVCVVCSVVAGYAMGETRSPLHSVGFALVLAVTVIFILDLEYPRLGWIRLDRADLPLVMVRESMG